MPYHIAGANLGEHYIQVYCSDFKKCFGGNSLAVQWVGL